MKRLLFFALAYVGFLFHLWAQVTIVAPPKKGFENRIRQYIDAMHVVDTHEHLSPETALKGSETLDFMWLFHHYADDDIKSAGMSKSQFNTLLTDSLTTAEKWRIMKPFYKMSFNTAYNRTTMLACDKLFGISELNEKSVEELSRQVKKAYSTSWYETILRNKCRIDFLINDAGRNENDPAYYRYTKRFGYFNLDSREKINLVARQQGTVIKTLDDLENTLRTEFQKSLKEGITVIKNSVAYFRTLYFEDVPKAEAERVFLKIMNSQSALSMATVQPLSDYMMHRLLDLAAEKDIPVQIHTGLQAGDGNFITNSNPALLSNLFIKYRNVRFILFHGGYPYGGEYGTLAKNFRNVYLDLCWLYIISPSYSERYLNEWLETVPAGKIMAFGGDYENVENVYGHLLLAKEIIGNVLTEKVKKRYLSEPEAIRIAQMILHDNAIRVFNLK